jgi:hypothetical protein
LRLELPERLLDDFVACAIFQPFSFASLRAAFALAAVPLSTRLPLHDVHNRETG